MKLPTSGWRPAEPWGFLLIFLGVQALLFTLANLAPVRDAVIVPFTGLLALISGSLVSWFDTSVVASGVIIRDAVSGFAVRIEAGCNGVEPSILLIAAVIAFKATWKQRLIGIGMGILAIMLLNLVRIISLFYLGQWNETAFNWAHLYLWQALIMIDALLAWLIWAHYVRRSEA